VFRVKRVRNLDAVSLEKLEHILRDAQGEGMTVLLAGIRPDLGRCMERLRFARWFPTERWFSEEERVQDAATLKAVRHAYRMLGIERPADSVAYYLV
jgi:SulP family sulfate permease